MDIHRCRFVPYQPQSINSLSFSHASNPKQSTPTDLKLAIGRAHGDIEIWNPSRGEWIQERIFRGGVGRTIEQLQWTQDFLASDEDDGQPATFESGRLRLFSIGGSKSITEWDMEKGTPKRHVDGNSDDIWCFAVQPQWTLPQAKNTPEAVRAAPSQLIAAGCANGSIVLFSTADDDLQYVRVLAPPHTRKSRCLCLTWRDRNTVVAGFEESAIRVIDVRNRVTVRNMSLGKTRDGPKPMVWAVKCLPNGTILSGDSAGELKIWDSQNYSLVQRLKTHQADILDLAANSAGTMILSCGVDRRTVAYAPHSGSANAKTQRWYEIRHRRFHEHDVKTMASFESNRLSIAASGGVDTVPVIIPLKNWNEEYHRSLPHLPHKSQMSVSTEARLMLTWWNIDLLVWHLPSRYDGPSDIEPVGDDQSQHRLLTHMQLKDDEFLTSAQISNDGTMIVTATSAGVRLFQIRRSVSSDGKRGMRSRLIELPNMVAVQGATSVGFSPDSKWLYAVRLNNVIAMVKITPASSKKEQPLIHERVIKLDRRSRKQQSTKSSSAGHYLKHITTVAFSSDSRVLAVGDLSGAIDTWILEGHESTPTTKTEASSDSEGDDLDSDSDSEDETDSRVVHGQKWSKTPAGSQLPSLESGIVTLVFRPSSAKPDRPKQIHGNEGLHVTRHTHHPVAPEHPAQESGLLFAVTANHSIVEFDSINCRLSDWSRRNPSSMLPEHFRRIKDRVMGMWFDQRPERSIDRLWLYGSNFIYMLDLSRALERKSSSSKALVKVGELGSHILEVPSNHALAKIEEESKRGIKRKRNFAGGAGDEMRDGHKYSTTVKPVITEDSSGREARLPSPPDSVKQGDDGHEDHDVDDMDVDEEVKDANSLAVQRRKSLADDQNLTVEADHVDTSPASWYSFQYRGIFGISASQSVGGEEDNLAPEVVIVEKPLYDVELSPRFMGGQDW